jgi:hypothetical protein
MFIKKPGGGIRLYIDYRKLNTIIKKDRYLIPLIKKIIINIISYKIIIKLDIRKAFNRIRLAIPKNKELLLFYIPFRNYKPKVL